MTAPAQGPWPGRFVWHDLMTTDAAKSKEFYGALFDWQIEERPMQGFIYHMLMLNRCFCEARISPLLTRILTEYRMNLLP